MSEVKIVSSVSVKALQRAVHSALKDIVTFEAKGAGKYASAGIALNAFALALGYKAPWFFTATKDLEGPIREEYDLFSSELKSAGHPNPAMCWARVKEGAGIALRADIQGAQGHPWAAAMGRLDAVKQKADAKLQAERDRKAANAAANAKLKQEALDKAKVGAVKPLAAEVAAKQDTGPVPTVEAEHLMAAQVASLPPAERITLEFFGALASAVARVHNEPDAPPIVKGAATAVSKILAHHGAFINAARAALNKVVTK